MSLYIKYHRGKTNIKHLSFHCSQVAHLSLIVSRGKTVMRGLLGVVMVAGGWDIYLQDAYGLEASEGSLGDVADGVVAQTESVEIPQHSQTAFIQTSQVVVRQIPGERNRARGRQKRGQRQTQRRREKERGKKRGKKEKCSV